MKKQNAFWFLISTIVITTQILSASAVSKTYDWQVYGDTHFSVSLIAENPQLDSPFDITLRMSLTSKDWTTESSEILWIQIILDSVDRALHIESGKQGVGESLVFTTVGDSHQKAFTFRVSSSEYAIGRGQSVSISVIYKITIDSIDVPRHLHWINSGDNINDPMIIVLTNPLLTTSELIIVLIIAIIITSIIARFIYLEIRERRMKKEERLKKEAEERRREKIIGESFQCPFCHTLYDKKLAKCPHCGAPKKLEG